MIVKRNVPIYDICWLNHTNGGVIGELYTPESIDELRDICSKLYGSGQKFDLIGHTSNIYFLPNYNVDVMVSTRKCNHYSVLDDCIECECGTSVRKLAKQMVNEGIKGFEGLIDLPGTVGAAVYGNASCYNCSITNLLISSKILLSNGSVVTMSPNELCLSKRSSVLKRGELDGVILSVKLNKCKDDSIRLEQLAKVNHQKRIAMQPGPKDNLGSIYAISDGWTIYSLIPRVITKVYALVLFLCGDERNKIDRKKKEFLFHLLGADDILPYVYNWNRYIWKDERSHVLFWKYHQLHQKMFKESIFEIEIRGEHI